MSNIKLNGKWLVIGPGSLTGSRFIELLDESCEIYGAGGPLDESIPNLKGFEKLDITNPAEVSRIISGFPVDFVINFAGATLVDEIEKNRPTDINDQTQLDQNLAYKVNVIGTKNIIAACQSSGKLPIFISTGFVFDGKNGSYSEESEIASDPNEVCWYAWTKVLAERAVAESGIKNVAIRISYPYRSEYEGKTDFARSLLKVYDEVKAGTREKMYPIFADQTLTPTFIDDIPEAVNILVNNHSEGIFHLTSPEITTPYDFCLELLRVARGVENPEEIVPKGNIVEFQNQHPELAKRPIKGGEKTDKIQSLGFTPTDWKSGIQKAFGK